MIRVNMPRGRWIRLMDTPPIHVQKDGQLYRDNHARMTRSRGGASRSASTRSARAAARSISSVTAIRASFRPESGSNG